MPNARYKFVRNATAQGFLSSNRPSTDALRALDIWASGASGRSYTVHMDEDESLVVDLVWSGSDLTAGAELDQFCYKCGVDRSHVQS